MSKPAWNHEDAPAEKPKPGPALLPTELNAQVSQGVLHEVNNSMTGIYFTVEAMMEGEDLPAIWKQSLGEVLQELRAAQMQLNRLGEIQLGLRETAYHDVRTLATGQLDLLHLIFGKHPAMTVLMPEEPLYLRLDEAGFRQALLEAAFWLKKQGKATGKVTLQIQPALNTASGEPMVELWLGAAGERPKTAAGLPDLKHYGGMCKLREAQAAGEVGVTLRFPRVELSVD